MTLGQRAARQAAAVLMLGLALVAAGQPARPVGLTSLETAVTATAEPSVTAPPPVSTETPRPSATPTATAGPRPFEQRRTGGGWLEWLPCMAGYADRFPEQSETLAIYRERIIYWAQLIDQVKTRDPKNPNAGHTIPTDVAAAVIMQESRGSPLAAGCAGEVGLFQILPGDAAAFIPYGCGGGRTVVENRPSTAWLQQSRHNVEYGLSILERLTWEAIAYADGSPAPEYRAWLDVVAPGTDELGWWYSDVGRVAVAMYQCGPAGFRAGMCGEHGGLEYAARVLDCWVPWVAGVRSAGQ